MGLFTSFAQEAVPTLTSYTEPTTEINSGFLAAYFIFIFAVLVISIVAYWKIFTKAGEAGWQSIVPIWNYIVLLRVVGRPAWWLLLMFVPFVGIVVSVIVALDLGKSFGKSTVFSVFGLILFSLVGYLILGFGSDEYVGPGGEAPAVPVQATA